jgi:hypothetical protein
MEKCADDLGGGAVKNLELTKQTVAMEITGAVFFVN